MSGMPAAVTKAFGGLKQMEWKKPKDGKEFLGCLIGGRQDTRREIAEELIKRYGIRVLKHFGDEMKKTPGAIFIDPRVEVVVFLADDLSDIVLNKVLACCRAGGQTHVGINRKQKQTWDVHMGAAGFSNPPKWNLIPNIADPDTLEAKRLAELAALDAMEKPRTAYADEVKVTLGDKLKLVATEKPDDIINKYKPAPKVVPVAVVKTGKSGRGTAHPGLRSADAGSTPWAATIIKAREALGITQGKAARKMGISQGNLSSYERGKTIPLYATWILMKAVLGDEIGKPPGMLGQTSYEERGGADLPGKPPKPSLTAKEAFSAKPTPEPVVTKVEAPAPAPPVVTPPPAVVLAAPPTPAQDPERFAAKVIKAMDQEELLTVNLRSGGTITLTASVQLMKIKKEDREFVFSIIDALQAYEEKKE